jgi:hypothetical protein
MSRTRCTNHCASCGLHFHSVSAFDAHRVGSFSDPEDPRRCEHPIDMVDKSGQLRCVELSTDGVCAVYPLAEQQGVTIWTLRAGLEAARERWAA